MKFKMNFDEKYRVEFPDGVVWQFNGHVVPENTPRSIHFHTDQGEFNILITGQTAIVGPRPPKTSTPSQSAHGTILSVNGKAVGELQDITPPGLLI